RDSAAHRATGAGSPGPGPGPPGGPGPDSPAGVGLAFAAYGVWGLFPLYFALLAGVGPVEVVAHRIVWALVFCAGLLAVAGGRLGAGALRRLTARQFAVLVLAAVVLSVNWGVFVYAVESGQVVQSSLGYFTNPLVSVVLGVLVLKERLRRWQWAAVAVAGLAVVVLTVDAGRPPWIALTLAGSFGVYGLLKNRVGRSVGALPGMTVETAALLVPAVAVLAAVHAGLVGDGGGAFGAGVSGGSGMPSGPGMPSASGPVAVSLLLVGSGPLTAVTLVVFAAAARRIRLSTLGLIQYVTPVMHLLLGLLVFGEEMLSGRWLGFGLVWVALVVLTVDSLTTAHRRRTAVAPPA
ncbi:MAG: EamA family transporter RarD, partial [Kineosporiaceae bacterium]